MQRALHHWEKWQRQLPLQTPTRRPLSLAAQAAGAKANTCTGPSPISFASYADPTAGTGGTACTTSSSAACQYSVGKTTLATAAATTQAYEVCSYLETGSGSLPAGMVHIDNTTGGAVCCRL